MKLKSFNEPIKINNLYENDFDTQAPKDRSQIVQDLNSNKIYIVKERKASDLNLNPRQGGRSRIEYEVGAEGQLQSRWHQGITGKADYK